MHCDRRSQVRDQFEPVMRLSACVLHAMMRPRAALRAALRPLLLEIGDASVVTLQVRTGWADDCQELAVPTSMTQLAWTLQKLRRRGGNWEDILRADFEAAPNGSLPAALVNALKVPAWFAKLRGRTVRRGNASTATASWLGNLTSTLLGGGGVAQVILERWARITAYSCHRQKLQEPPPADLHELLPGSGGCVGPSPKWWHERMPQGEPGRRLGSARAGRAKKGHSSNARSGYWRRQLAGWVAVIGRPVEVPLAKCAPPPRIERCAGCPDVCSPISPARAIYSQIRSTRLPCLAACPSLPRRSNAPHASPSRLQLSAARAAAARTAAVAALAWAPMPSPPAAAPPVEGASIGDRVVLAASGACT